MTTVLQQLRWRRIGLAGAATALVHYLVAGWVDGGGSAARPGLAPPKERAATPVVAQLLPSLPLPLPAPAAATVASAAVQARQVQSGNRKALPKTPARSPRYQASLPSAAELTFDLARGMGGVVAASGEATLDWRLEGAAYALRYRAALTAPEMGSLVEMTSEGKVGDVGIVPRTMTERRRNRSCTATHFDTQGNITFSASQHAVPMTEGAQDKATWPMQLAAIARGGSAQLIKGIALQVGEDKDASQYRFDVQGQEEIDTGMGVLATWRLARVPAPGSYNARLDIWLAPDHHWYPVQLRSTEANGTVTTQTIRKIVVKDAGN